MRKLIFLLLVILISIVVYFNYFSTPPLVAIPSKSMEPEYSIGELIFIKTVDANNIKVGDVVVVTVPKEAAAKYGYPPSIIHRVVEVMEKEHGKAFSLKGDNNEEKDPFIVYEDEVNGKAVYSIPYIGHIILFLHSKFGKYFLGTLLLLYTLNFTYINFRKKLPILLNYVSILLMSNVEKELISLKKTINYQSEQIDKLRKELKDMKQRD